MIIIVSGSSSGGMQFRYCGQYCCINDLNTQFKQQILSLLPNQPNSSCQFHHQKAMIAYYIC